MKAKKPTNNLDYGPVYITGGYFRGRIMYYDDDEDDRTAICCLGHLIDFGGTYNIPRRFLREPLIDDLLARSQSFLSRQLAGGSATILPVLLEKCEVPAILADLKYANFAESYQIGLKELLAAVASKKPSAKRDPPHQKATNGTRRKP